MSLRDLHNHVTVKRMLSPAAVSDNTAQVSQIIDTQGYGAVEILIAAGSLADADVTFTTLLEDGNNSGLSDNATVASTFILGSIPAITFANDDTVYKLGYIGSKRYLRLTITPANNASAANFAAVAVLGRASYEPAA